MQDTCRHYLSLLNTLPPYHPNVLNCLDSSGGPGTVTSGRATNSHDSIIIFRLAPKVLYCPWTSALFFLWSGFFDSWEFWCRALRVEFLFLLFEFSRFPHIAQCVDYCWWSITGHSVKFVNSIRWNTLSMSTEKQRHRDTETQNYVEFVRWEFRENFISSSSSFF